MSGIPEEGKNADANEYSRMLIEFHTSFFYGVAKSQLKDASKEALVDSVCSMKLKSEFMAMELECFKDYLARKREGRPGVADEKALEA